MIKIKIDFKKKPNLFIKKAEKLVKPILSSEIWEK